jgi:predicted RNase H-like HicB family nuclease
MQDKIVVFPIIIKKNASSEKYPYFVQIPDLQGVTEGKSVIDAIEMAKDYIGTFSLENELPSSNAQLPVTHEKDKICTLVTVNISAYQRAHDFQKVKKTITIPNYLNELGQKKRVNFSELMTEALKKKLNLE